MSEPKLSLVGAGPGDPELITLKALRVLKSADVVLYDSLLDPRLLDHAPRAEKIFVGKRRGLHSHSQDEINDLIVQSALRKGHVVRLKGGDPLIFGRGSEEADYARRFGIKVEIVPGVSSAFAVPGAAGIPLSRRGLSESFWVITGTTSQRQLSPDVYAAARSRATAVILMGMSQLDKIVAVYRVAGRENESVAILQAGTTAKEQRVRGQIRNIQALVHEKGLANPAVIVIGPVADYMESLPEELLPSAVPNAQLLIA